MTARTALSRFATAALGVIIAVAAAPSLDAQTATTGVVAGMVEAAGGQPLEGVEVTLFRDGGADERVVQVGRDGRFRSGLLSPGQYEALVERFGFVPVRVSDITVRSGRQTAFRVTLREAPPPVTETDRYSFAQVATEQAHPGATRGLRRSDLDALPFSDHELTDVLARWTRAGTRTAPGFSIMGLPGQLTGVSVDGIRFEPLSHPRMGPGFLHFTALSPLFLQELEFSSQDLDGERGGISGARLAATTLQGGNRLEVQAFGGALGQPLGLDGPLGGSVDTGIAPEGGILVRGPIVSDTLHFALGVQARRASRTVSPFGTSSAEQGALFLDAIDDQDRPLDARLGPTRVDRWDAVSTFGRVDWNLSDRSTLTATSHVGLARAADPDDIPRPALAPPEGIDASDALVRVSYLRVMGDRGALEIRSGFESSSREYGGASLAGDALDGRTWIQTGGIVAGTDPTVPGRFQQSTLRLAPTVHFGARDHQIKAGMDVARKRFEEESMGILAPSAGHPDVQAFQEGRGFAVRRDGPRRDVAFDRSTLAFFVQDRWNPAPGLTMTGSLRFSGEALPLEDILPSEGWAGQTGLPRIRTDDDTRHRISPRLQVEWTPDAGGTWRLSGSAGIQHGEVHPGLLAEVLADSGAVRHRQSLGALSGSADDQVVFEGRTLSLLGPRFDAPRTQSLDLELARALRPGTSLELDFGVRQTDFLPRRRDLNRVPARYARDQFDRELFGEVVQRSGVIAVRPGSDRRFSDFATVSALESTGWATWWGLTLGVVHQGTGPLELNAAYTYSRTRDNLPQGGTGWPTLTAGQTAGSGAGEAEWVEGRSDLDVPHRFVASGTFELLESPGLRVGALYGFRSGTPFTPGIRDLLHGSDPLGPGAVLHGSGTPISIPADMGAPDQLTREWPCVADLVGAGRERNTCRTSGIHDLNLRLGMDLGTRAGWRITLDVDALNLLDDGPYLPDPAVFVVDGSGDLPAVSNGRLSLPVTVNPNFGAPLVRLSPGRSLRIGLGLRY